MWKSSLSTFVFPKASDGALVTFSYLALKNKNSLGIPYCLEETLNFSPWCRVPWGYKQNFLSESLAC